MWINKPEFFDKTNYIPGASVVRGTAQGIIKAGDPLALGTSGDQVAPANGATSTDVAWAGVAVTDAADGAEVFYVNQGPASVTKDTGAAWAPGDVIGVGAAKSCTVSSQDLDGTKLAKQDLGYAISVVAAGATSGIVFVQLG